MFLSGDGGWELGVINMAHALANMGAVVIGVDIRHYLASLGSAAQRGNAPCQMIAADFETLSHQVQKEIGMSEYHVPVLVGYSSGATRGVRGAGAVTAGHFRRRAQPRLLRRPGLRRRAAVPRRRSALHAE